jgi:predicted acylesterase/phospholipase RssA
MQLGVIHALMVSRAKAPDVVVGVSAGAFNAVALADILQAGSDTTRPPTDPDSTQPAGESSEPAEAARDTATAGASDDSVADAPTEDGASDEGPSKPKTEASDDRLSERVAAFRRLFGRYRDAPGELASALLPDSYQIDSRKPLEVLRLSTQFAEERKARSLGSRSRRGLVNLYNRLLGVPISVGTITRAIRRFLGLTAAKNSSTWRSGSPLRAKLRQMSAQFPQLVLLWKLLGWNLHKMPPIAALVRGGLSQPHKPGSLVVGGESRQSGTGGKGGAGIHEDEGLTAGELLFASRFWPWLGRVLYHGLLFLAWSVLWVIVTFVFLALFGAAAWFAAWLLRLLAGLLPFVPASGPAGPQRTLTEWVPVAAVLYIAGAFTGAALYGLGLRSWQRFRAALKTLVELTVLTATWGLVTGALILGIAAAIVFGTNQSWVPTGTALLILTGFASLGLFVWGAVQAVLMAVRRRKLFPWVLRRHYLGRSLLDPHPLRELLVSIFDAKYYGPHPEGARFRLEDVVSSALNEDQPVDLGYARRTLEACHRKQDPPIHVAVVAADVERGRPDVLSADWSVVDALMAATASPPFFPAVGRKDKNGAVKYFVDASGVANEPTRMSLAYLRRRVNKDVGVVELYSVSPFPLSDGSNDSSAWSQAGAGNAGDAGQAPAPGDAAGTKSDAYRTLVEVVTRAKELERFRDARLEHRLTRLYSKVMGGRTRVLPITRRRPRPDGREKASEKMVIDADVYAIEPDAPLRLSRRLLRENDERGRRRIIAQGVAAGCRATLEVIALDAADPENEPPVSCWTTMAKRLETTNPEVPGADREYGPGVPEVCRQCRSVFNKRPKRGPDTGTAEQPVDAEFDKEGVLARRNHAVKSRWPTRREAEAERNETAGHAPGDAAEENLTSAQSLPENDAPDADAGCEADAVDESPITDPIEVQGSEAPAAEAGNTSPDKGRLANWPRGGMNKPTVSMVFSGGVFRGVFQVGVIAAANELGIRPDIVAGASVGSITAAMAASAYAVGTSPGGPDDIDARRRAIARVAATYLAVDRLVLTDRFADFIREFTVRAAAARFSLRDADRVFRKYDEALPGVFGRESRRLAAGIERLTYVSPIELAALIRDLRTRSSANAVRRLRDYFQELLDRSGVGREILGAEPLAFLIREHVLRPLAEKMPDFTEQDIDRLTMGAYLQEAGVYFVATATNLHKARLELLGDVLQSDDADDASDGSDSRSLRDGLSDNLLESLLASSAFPGVFRPRWSWEVRPESGSEELLIDGGVMDNLPLDAVAGFLKEAAKQEIITARPPSCAPQSGSSQTPGNAIPHLILCAPLRPSPAGLGRSDADGEADAQQRAAAVNEIVSDWKKLHGRVSEMKYNDKIEMYTNTQAMVRAIVDRVPSDDPAFPLDLEVVPITPRWVCGTFAFHPMLGFQRDEQARSIAHGCASTRVQMQTMKVWRDSWVKAWTNIDGDGQCANRPAEQRWWELHLNKADKQKGIADGRCWFLGHGQCPFSMVKLKESFHEELKSQRREPISELIEEVAQIHVLCCESETHNPE